MGSSLFVRYSLSSPDVVMALCRVGISDDSATRVALCTKDVMISSCTADVLLPWFELQSIISCARGRMKRVLSPDSLFDSAPIRLLDFIAPRDLVASGREEISDWVPQNDKGFFKIKSRLNPARVLEPKCHSCDMWPIPAGCRLVNDV